MFFKYQIETKTSKTLSLIYYPSLTSVIALTFSFSIFNTYLAPYDLTSYDPYPLIAITNSESPIMIPSFLIPITFLTYLLDSFYLNKALERMLKA